MVLLKPIAGIATIIIVAQAYWELLLIYIVYVLDDDLEDLL